MAKILISLIGTGKKSQGDYDNNEYEKTDYIIDEILYSDQTLVAHTIINHYNIEKTYFIGTKSSMWDNICQIFNGDEEYQLELMEKKDKKENSILEEADLTKLNKYISNKLGFPGSKCLVVNDGETQEDLWAIFEKLINILEELSPEDEVYFDITHLFRSLSVMSFIMAEFGKTYKKFKVSKFLYGKLKVGEPSPIIDLSVFFELLDWSKAIENLKKYGNSSDLKNLISTANFSNDIESSFSNFSNALSISDMGAMQGSIKTLKSKIKSFENSDNHIIKLISKDLNEFIDRFHNLELSKFQLELSKWYIENKNYAMGYITVVEAIITKVCNLNNLENVSREGRDEAKKILWDYEYKGSQDERKIYKIYKRMNDIRNNIAHKIPGKNQRYSISPQKAIEMLPNDIRELQKLLFSK